MSKKFHVFTAQPMQTVSLCSLVLYHDTYLLLYSTYNSFGKLPSLTQVLLLLVALAFKAKDSLHSLSQCQLDLMTNKVY